MHTCTHAHTTTFEALQKRQLGLPLSPGNWGRSLELFEHPALAV